MEPKSIWNWLLLLYLVFAVSDEARGASVVSGKVVGEGLEFWLEIPAAQIVSGGSIHAIMMASNQLSVPRPFTEMKGRYYDTSIGDFEVTDSITGLPVESIIPNGERIQIMGFKGLFLAPTQHLVADGYLNRAFSLTNAGKYLISAKGRFRSTNWSGQPPGEFIDLVTPPVEIEILPSTNVVKTTASIGPNVVPPPAPVSGTRTRAHSPSDLKAPVASGKEPSPVVSETMPSSTTGRRDLAFAALTLLPIIGLIGWIVWRRCRKTD